MILQRGDSVSTQSFPMLGRITTLRTPHRERPSAKCGRRSAVLVALLTLAPLLAGCVAGPKMLERSHGHYNDAVKQVGEEQMLLNVVRMRYNESPMRLDVSAIAAQYEVDASVEGRPFFATESYTGVIEAFSRVLPFASVRRAERPTLSLTPLDDPDNIRSLFTPATLDAILFLSETSYPVSTIYRLFVEHLNRLPNAVAASGPPRGLVPEFREFRRTVELMQLLQDRGDLRFVREEKVTEMGDPLPAESITATAQVEAAKGGFEYRRKSKTTWVLVRRDRRLEMKLNPAALSFPEVQELCRLLRLNPGQSSYEVNVGGTEETFSRTEPPGPATALHLYPRSVTQAFFYMAHGVLLPPEHVKCGLVEPTVAPDGTAFDWQQVTEGLFTVHSAPGHVRPKHAAVAVKYRGCWFYVDDRDNDSKITFALMLTMTRLNLLGGRKGGPTLTLPVGR